jgi:hypothetical protein
LTSPVEVYNGKLNGSTVKLQNGTSYKLVRDTTRYVLHKSTCYLHNGTVTKKHVLQSGMCYKTVRVTKPSVKIVPVHVTKRYMILEGHLA